ncbi:hypothetical protein Y032_0016g3120 [Ancylostoma ceylanicum]|uniref:SCP domain-containing protein n=1 Tax=Ancylostoma ceylanicum TaxID=53326 RepID=A0A016V6Q6_9BILA|nr:hypothetical protein Y032_0016g3120 [Ancylostoma ceylanicum]
MPQKSGQQNLHLPLNNLPNFGKMMWESLSYVGCAVVRCTSFTNVVCHFGPIHEGVGKWGSQIYFMGGRICGQCRSPCVDGLCS